jgi:hypothetical protein
VCAHGTVKKEYFVLLREKEKERVKKSEKVEYIIVEIGRTEFFLVNIPL